MRELILHCSEQQAESLSDALLELGVLSVSVEDADEHTEQENRYLASQVWSQKSWRGNVTVWLLYCLKT